MCLDTNMDKPTIKVDFYRWDEDNYNLVVYRNSHGIGTSFGPHEIVKALRDIADSLEMDEDIEQ